MPSNVGPLPRLRKLCLALPETSEKLSHGEPTFFVKGKVFVMFAHADSHHGRGRFGAWCAAEPGAQDVLVGSDPDRFFVPPYFGPRGWIGVWLDGAADWRLIAAIVRDAYLVIAPARVAAQLQGAPVRVVAKKSKE